MSPIIQHIIVGAGPAGVIAAETLRKTDPNAAITLIGDEAEPPYSRMAIPYYLINHINESGSYLRNPETHYQHLNIELIQQKAIQIDTKKKQLIMADGSRRDYDKLLLAMGSRPINPPIPGLNLPQVSSCWTLADARTIIKRAQTGASVVLIGAGFIGCIILEALVRRGVHLSVIETGNRMVPRMLNDKAGNLLRQWCINQGIHVHTACSVASIRSIDNDQVAVNLSDGNQCTASLVISATGVQPNIEILEGTDIEVDHGIRVNACMQTSNTDVYAAGDVAQGMDFSTGGYEVQAIQPTATDHGRIAALNMAGCGNQHQGTLNMNVLDTLGLVSCSFGQWMGVKGGEQAEWYNPDKFQYINLQFAGDQLVGASSVGKTQHIGVLRGLIESRVSLRHWKQRLIDNPMLTMEAYIACTQAINYH